MDHATEVDRPFEEAGTTAHGQRVGHRRERVSEKMLFGHERDAKLLEAPTDVFMHQVLRPHMSPGLLVFP